MSTFSKNFGEWMRKNHLTCLTASERLGVASGTVSRWRAGYKPSLRLKKQALAVMELFSDAEPRLPSDIASLPPKHQPDEVFQDSTKASPDLNRVAYTATVPVQITSLEQLLEYVRRHGMVMFSDGKHNYTIT